MVVGCNDHTAICEPGFQGRYGFHFSAKMSPQMARAPERAALQKATFRWGCLGALLPPLLSLYKNLEAGRIVPHLWLYYPVLLVWILASGACAIAWRPDSEWKAIWVGASVPALAAYMIASPLVH
jgi:hypothetical protein